MSQQEEYIEAEKERIAELISRVDNLRILGRIYKFIIYITKK